MKRDVNSLVEAADERAGRRQMIGCVRRRGDSSQAELLLENRCKMNTELNYLRLRFGFMFKDKRPNASSL